MKLEIHLPNLRPLKVPHSPTIASPSPRDGEGGRETESRFRDPPVATLPPSGDPLSVAQGLHAVANESIFDEGPAWKLNNRAGSTPWRAICHLEIAYSGGGTATGTGWLAGPDTVITAGHNVFSAKGSGWASEITVYPGRSGGSKPWRVFGEKVDALRGWRERLDPVADLGMIRLNAPAHGHDSDWFGVLEISDQDLAEKPDAFSIGYPGSAQGTQWFDYGPIVGHDSAFIHHRLDTMRGNSGGPLVIQGNSGRWRVIGTHVYGETTRNLARRINGHAFDAVAAWITA
ncbi:MAG: trypsin-like peptidase domain-containing protein [Pseudomonadota bacterium]